MELMRSFPDGYFELCVIDPPYGINMAMGHKGSEKRGDKNKYKSFAGNDNSIPNKAYFVELERVSKNQIVWGANYMIEHLKPTPCFIVWDKVQPEAFSMAMCEIAWTSFKSPAKIFKKRIVDADDVRIHPTQKPVKLYDWIFKNYLPNGGKVLDTHGGSMSSVVSAIKAGNIEMTCSELDKDYFKAAKERILTFQSQLDMFTPPADVIFHE